MKNLVNVAKVLAFLLVSLLIGYFIFTAGRI